MSRQLRNRLFNVENMHFCRFRYFLMTVYYEAEDQSSDIKINIHSFYNYICLFFLLYVNFSFSKYRNCELVAL